MPPNARIRATEKAITASFRSIWRGSASIDCRSLNDRGETGIPANRGVPGRGAFRTTAFGPMRHDDVGQHAPDQFVVRGPDRDQRHVTGRAGSALTLSCVAGQPLDGLAFGGPPDFVLENLALTPYAFPGATTPRLPTPSPSYKHVSHTP